MNVVQPPTDSLYKFMAVSGTILMLVILIYPRVKITELNREIANLEGGIKVAQLRKDRLTSKEKSLNREYESLKAEVNTLETKVHASSNETFNKGRRDELNTMLFSRSEDLKGKAEELLKTRHSLDDAEQQIEEEGISLEVKSDLIKGANEELKDYLRMFQWGGPIAFNLMFWGFFLWYRKVQRYQDLILKLKYEAEASAAGVEESHNHGEEDTNETGT